MPWGIYVSLVCTLLCTFACACGEQWDDEADIANSMDDFLEIRTSRHLPGFCGCKYPHPAFLPNRPPSANEYIFHKLHTHTLRRQDLCRYRCSRLPPQRRSCFSQRRAGNFSNQGVDRGRIWRCKRGQRLDLWILSCIRPSCSCGWPEWKLENTFECLCCWERGYRCGEKHRVVSGMRTPAFAVQLITLQNWLTCVCRPPYIRVGSGYKPIYSEDVPPV